MFLPKLRTHIISQLTHNTLVPGSLELQQAINGFQIQHDRIYQHAILGINYTSYDIRRCSDCIHPNADRKFVAVKATNDGTHPFWYAKVLGIFHALVSFPGYPLQRVDFLWIRWLARDLSWKSGWESCRLDRVCYFETDPEEESLPPFDFLNPSEVVRATHLIPAFQFGNTLQYLGNKPSFAYDTPDAGDWRYWYVMRYV